MNTLIFRNQILHQEHMTAIIMLMKIRREKTERKKGKSKKAYIRVIFICKNINEVVSYEIHAPVKSWAHILVNRKAV